MSNRGTGRDEEPMDTSDGGSVMSQDKRSLPKGAERCTGSGKQQLLSAAKSDHATSHTSCSGKSSGHDQATSYSSKITDKPQNCPSDSSVPEKFGKHISRITVNFDDVLSVGQNDPQRTIDSAKNYSSGGDAKAPTAVNPAYQKSDVNSIDDTEKFDSRENLSRNSGHSGNRNVWDLGNDGSIVPSSHRNSCSGPPTSKTDTGNTSNDAGQQQHAKRNSWNDGASKQMDGQGSTIKGDSKEKSAFWPPNSSDEEETMADTGDQQPHEHREDDQQQQNFSGHHDPPLSAGVDISSLKRLSAERMPDLGEDYSEKPPAKGRPEWDNQHVRMPYADPRSGDRWRLIDDKLRNLRKLVYDHRQVINVSEFERLITTYNPTYFGKWDFGGFSHFIQDMKFDEKICLLDVIERMANLARELKTICPQPIPLLKQGQNKTLTLGQRQIACLLANAFFCTFPMRNQKPFRGANPQYGSRPDIAPLPSINFSSLFKKTAYRMETQVNKLRCIFNYFDRVTSSSNDQRPNGKVTFERRHLKDEFDWKTSTSQFTELHVSSSGKIEEDGAGMAQVDFANKLVGGGVLGRGCVQEEITFLGFTELIVSRLFTEELCDRDCLIVTGAEKYNNYRGYSDTFRFLGDCRDHTPCDRGRRMVQVIIIDATRFFVPAEQFCKWRVERELNKAFCGFRGDPIHNGPLPAVATGNWGCGDFRGDRQLKSIIQLMAAAEARRDICYFTYHDNELVRQMNQVHELFRKFRLTVGDVCDIIIQFLMAIPDTEDRRDRLFNFILTTYGGYSNGGESETTSF